MSPSSDRPFTRVVRRNGRAIREYVPAGPVANLLHAEAEAQRLEQEAIRHAHQQLVAQLELSRNATDTAAEAISQQLRKFIVSQGFHRTHGAWRQRRMTVLEFLKHNSPIKPDSAASDRITDLARTAQEAWLDLVAQGDASVAQAVRAELATMRQHWLEPNDPPALRVTADAMALVWLQMQYFSFRYAAARKAERPGEELGLLYEQYEVAEDRLRQWQEDLLVARKAQASWKRLEQKLADWHDRTQRRQAKAKDATASRPRLFDRDEI